MMLALAGSCNVLVLSHKTHDLCTRPTQMGMVMGQVISTGSVQLATSGNRAG